MACRQCYLRDTSRGKVAVCSAILSRGKWHVCSAILSETVGVSDMYAVLSLVKQ